MGCKASSPTWEEANNAVCRGICQQGIPMNLRMRLTLDPRATAERLVEIRKLTATDSVSASDWCDIGRTLCEMNWLLEPGVLLKVEKSAMETVSYVPTKLIHLQVAMLVRNLLMKPLHGGVVTRDGWYDVRAGGGDPMFATRLEPPPKPVYWINGKACPVA